MGFYCSDSCASLAVGKKRCTETERLRMKVRVNCLSGNPMGPFSSMWYGIICFLNVSANWPIVKQIIIFESNMYKEGLQDALVGTHL